MPSSPKEVTDQTFSYRIAVNADTLEYHLNQHPSEITEVIKLIGYQLKNHYITLSSV